MIKNKTEATASRGFSIKTRGCPIGGGKCFFKKGGIVLRQRIQVKYAMIKEESAQFPVSGPTLRPLY